MSSVLLFSGIDPPDAEKEKSGIVALHIKERDVPHSVRKHTEYTAVALILKKVHGALL